ncbi:hypothetical protein BH20ACI2_BH20ACI2_01650 [soil metagenome]
MEGILSRAGRELVQEDNRATLKGSLQLKPICILESLEMMFQSIQLFF